MALLDYKAKDLREEIQNLEPMLPPIMLSVTVQLRNAYFVKP